LANRIGARFTTFVATTAKADDLPHGRLIGMPLRRSIATLDRAAARADGRSHFNLDPSAPTLLVFGGSQGARSLNAAVTAAAPALRAAGIGVLHAVGRDNYDAEVAVRGLEGSGPPYVVVPYLERMDLAYAAADLALCRSGAMTCAELSAVGLPAVYVPLPIGNGEQRRNALPIVEAGGGILVEDSELTPEWITATVIPLLTDAARTDAMSKAAAGHGRPGADEELADLVQAAIAARGTDSS
jgi:UDP-N-acetylglucosamine--N-acetylmuramyl-(pentapeptide) pyrophosphoryl-undecaprenol N-acetylglucosamine transferase